mmetsp:Transcript_13045/g.20710  ORF Transcript_13045/g.20710 Transcript_13045/m.20710 type:complete len:115 (-) Transcript_13045:486-830(-)
MVSVITSIVANVMSSYTHGLWLEMKQRNKKTLTYQNRPENAAKLDSAWTTALRHIALVYEQRLGNVYCPSCENHSTEHAQDDLARLISYLAPLKRQLCPFAVAIPHKNLETVND